MAALSRPIQPWGRWSLADPLGLSADPTAAAPALPCDEEDRPSPPTCCVAHTLRSSSNDLAVLIARMQTNADQVEKDILDTQSLLAQVRCGTGQWDSRRLWLEMQSLE